MHKKLVVLHMMEHIVNRLKRSILVLFGGFIGLTGLLILCSFHMKKNQPGPQPLKVIIAMLDSIQNIKSYQFNIKALERAEGGEYLTAESMVKMNVSPKALYFRNEKKKLSIMYVAGTNGNKALVKSKTLLNTTISLDPLGSTMRKNQHYTIHELGFGYIGRTIAQALLKDKDHISKHLKYLDRKVINGIKCVGIVFEDPDFKYIDYETKGNETIASLAQKFNVAEFQIRLKNGLTNFYGSFSAGKKLKIPTNYCKKLVIYISESTLFPVSLSIYDEVGLYENYEYYNVKTNLVFTSADFGKFYKD